MLSKQNKNMKLGVPEQEGQLQMMFARGGPRQGAGRKSIGETRKISLTMSGEAWAELERRCSEAGSGKSELLRSLVEPLLQAGDGGKAGESQ